MENKKPDNIVYTDEKGYNASFLPYATSVGAPIIKVDVPIERPLFSEIP